MLFRSDVMPKFAMQPVSKRAITGGSVEYGANVKHVGSNEPVACLTGATSDRDRTAKAGTVDPGLRNYFSE